MPDRYLLMKDIKNPKIYTIFDRENDKSIQCDDGESIVALLNEQDQIIKKMKST